MQRGVLVTAEPGDTAIDAMSAALSGQQTQMSALAQNSLSKGAILYMDGNYDAAAQQFKRAIALDSSPDNVSKAYDLLATVHISQNNMDPTQYGGYYAMG